MSNDGTVSGAGCETAQIAAQAYSGAIDDFIAFIRSLDPDQLDVFVPVEERSVRVMLYHVANGMRLTHEWLSYARRGAAVPPRDIDVENAEEARVHAQATREEVLGLFEQLSAQALDDVRTLTQHEWDRQVPFGPGGGIEMPVARIATAGERHVRVHLGHIREALGTA